MTDVAPEPGLPSDADTTVPHSARIWNYWLGGRLNYPVDRAAGEAYQQVYPQIVDVALASRGFQSRVVAYLAGPAGISQFLDVGAGLPAAPNTHEIAQGLNPAARVVYMDHDPFVVSYGRGSLSSTPAGVTEFLQGDLYQPADVLTAAARTPAWCRSRSGARTRASRGPRTSPTSAAPAGRPDRSWLPSIGGRPAPVRKR